MGRGSGSISLHCNDRFYSLLFPEQGWRAAEMVQYLDTVYTAPSLEVGVLKLLGFQLEIGDRKGARADEWVEIDLQEKSLATNSTLIRKAVKQEGFTEDDPFGPLALRNICRVLDGLDFSVDLYRD